MLIKMGINSSFFFLQMWSKMEYDFIIAQFKLFVFFFIFICGWGIFVWFVIAPICHNYCSVYDFSNIMLLNGCFCIPIGLRIAVLAQGEAKGQYSL